MPHTTRDGIPMMRWRCSVCPWTETIYSDQPVAHEVGGLNCLQRQVTSLQRQVTSLQETVDAIINKFGGEL